MSIDPKPNRLSPVHSQHLALGARFDLRGGWPIPEVYTSEEEEATVLRERVGLADISARGKLTFRGAHIDAILSTHLGEASTKPGDVIETKSDHSSIARLTLDEFLLLTPPGAEKELAASLEAEIISQGIFASLIDITSGMVGLSITGPESTALMSKLCALPFSPSEFPNLCVAQSSFAQVRTTIIRHDQGPLPAFELFADRSYGDYLWEAILDAGREFGMQPVGWEAIGRNTQKQI